MCKFIRTRIKITIRFVKFEKWREIFLCECLYTEVFCGRRLIDSFQLHILTQCLQSERYA